MLTAVLAFMALMAFFETILLSMLPEGWLERKWLRNAIHVAVFALNLCVHWGTVTGTMAATGAFCVSVAVVPAYLYLRRLLKARDIDPRDWLLSQLRKVFLAPEATA
ncbi:MAG: hypothetical protein LBU11_12405 [Zoogloeaceae bacterium]|jgi:hypothetical protein|nr:hypothetical protein [Zoogloeaceae bacterium]